MRVALFVLALSASVSAQTVGYWPASATDPNAEVPLGIFQVLPTCGVAKAPENIRPEDRPNVLVWDDTNAALDCSAPLTTTPIALLPPLAPDGYRAAMRTGTRAFGPLTSAFLAPAQTGCQIVAGQPFHVEMNHDGARTAGYRLYVNGSQVGPDFPASVQSGGVVSLPHAGIAAGAFTVEVGAYNASGEAKSPTASCQSVLPAPTAGTNTRIVQP